MTLKETCEEESSGTSSSHGAQGVLESGTSWRGVGTGATGGRSSRTGASAGIGAGCRRSGGGGTTTRQTDGLAGILAVLDKVYKEEKKRNEFKFGVRTAPTYIYARLTIGEFLNLFGGQHAAVEEALDASRKSCDERVGTETICMHLGDVERRWVRRSESDRSDTVSVGLQSSSANVFEEMTAK